MAQSTTLEITRREVMGKATKRLRKQGIIPANIFGHKEDSVAIQLDAVLLDRLLRSHGATGIISLMLSGSAAETALIRHVQHDPRSGKVIHVDFYRVRLDERIHSKVALRFVGEAPGVKIGGGVLLHLLDALEIECQAQAIPEYFEVDISPLAEINAMLTAGDVKLPTDFTLITDPTENIVKIAPTAREEAEEAAVESLEQAVENATAGAENTSGGEA